MFWQAMIQPRSPVRPQFKVAALVSVAHGYSHFSQLLLVPLFLYLKAEFQVSYTELGLLMTLFFIASGFAQSASGFLVDKVGALPVLLGSMAIYVVACVGLALAPSYWVLCVFSALAGLANAPFHPADFSILNSRIAPTHLGSAYAMHGVAGTLGWAGAPLFLAGLASISSWRWALVGAAAVAAVIGLMLWWQRDVLAEGKKLAPKKTESGGPVESAFSFMKVPAVWMSFLFFCAYAFSLGGVQSFGSQAASNLHEMPLGWVAMLLSIFMTASAVGMVIGGMLVKNPAFAERIMALGFSLGAVLALVIAFVDMPGVLVVIMFALMGAAIGLAGPSRDLLVRAATPAGATGRVYGLVYSGLDVGMACGPLLFGVLMDQKQPALVWVLIAVFQALLVLSALTIGARVKASGRLGVAA
jgi:MFS transporter, FSR family, fosmidomycin resistance protein